MDPLDFTLDELCQKNDLKNNRKRHRNHNDDNLNNRRNHTNGNYNNNNRNNYNMHNRNMYYQPRAPKRFKQTNNNHNENRNHYNGNRNRNQFNTNRNQFNTNRNTFNTNRNSFNGNRNQSNANRNRYNGNRNNANANRINYEATQLPSAPSSNYYIKSKQESKEEEAKEKDKQYAYVTLIMRGDHYVPGALILAHSLRLVDAKYSLIVMVTDDVTKKARDALQLLYDLVVDVPYVKYSGKCQRMKTDKQQKKYKEWASDSFTKWNLLQLNHLLKMEFDKLLFLDSDKIVIKNIDHLFTDCSLECPAGTFSSPWTKNSGLGSFGLMDYYPNTIKHGDEIPAKSIYNALYKNGFVAVGTSMMFKPSLDEYKKFIQMLDDKWISDENMNNDIDKEENNTNEGENGVSDKRMIGFKNCYSMLDEQSIVFFYYYHKIAWKHIDTKYNFIPWHFKWLENNEGKLEIPLVLHFFGMKPWNLSPLEWRDLQCWWSLCFNLINYAATKDYKWDESQQTLISSFFNLSLMNELPLNIAIKDFNETSKEITCFWCYEMAKRQGLDPCQAIKQDKCDKIEWIFHCPIDPFSGKLCCPKLI